jgi:hypothetical protein
LDQQQFGYFNNDGDIDILVVNGGFGAPFEDWLYSNDGNNNSWIKIKCVGTMSNRTAIGIFNLAGQEIATLFDGKQSAGEHQIQRQANGLPSGVYFFRLQAGELVETKKMILMR